MTERDSSRRWKVKVCELNEHNAALNDVAFVPFSRKKRARTFEQTKPLPIPDARVQQRCEVISNLLLEVRNIYCIFKGASV